MVEFIDFCWGENLKRIIPFAVTKKGIHFRVDGIFSPNTSIFHDYLLSCCRFSSVREERSEGPEWRDSHCSVLVASFLTCGANRPNRPVVTPNGGEI